MIVTISGYPGSGKSTVGKMLAKRWHCPYYSIGAIRRSMARERGMTLEEFNRYGESNFVTDRDVDAWQAKRGRELTTAVFEGRTAWHFIPQSIKVFFTVDPKVGAKRIAEDLAAHRRFEANWTNLASVERALSARIKSDSKRYRKYYRLNVFDRRHYDLIIDTTKHRPHDTLRMIVKYLANPVRGKSLNGAKVKQKTGTVRSLGIKNKLSTGSKRRRK
ncbi:MAG: cytidylate kinase family protein [Patescibacteria group bacterium]